MKRHHLVLLLLLANLWNPYSLSAIAEPAPIVVWSRHYDLGAFDDGYSVLETSSGNYLLVGSNSYGGIYAVMVNSQTGEKIWDRLYDGIWGGTAIEDMYGNFLISVAAGKVRRFHWPLQDPANPQQRNNEQKELFRQIRDEIKLRVESLRNDLINR